ncbi:MAG: SdpI family protein [Planctomycetota bacterium]|jgi:uncharacterized membrane protein
MKWSLRTELPLLLVLAAMFASAAWAWDRVPESMPVHYNLEGEPDRYGGRFEGLLLMPIIAAGTYLLFFLVPVLDPGRANYPRFASAFRMIRLAIVLFLAALYAFMVADALGADVPIGESVTMLVGALFIVLGFTMGKLRPNWFVGVRTPWTLSSKLSWTRSHRLAGWLFLISGAGTLILSPFSGRTALIFVIASGVLVGLTVVVYSYIVWRHDPDRVPPAGTSPAEDA